MFEIILKNRKTNKSVRLHIMHYTITGKEIVCQLTDNNIKRYQTNEWHVLSCRRGMMMITFIEKEW